MGFHGRSPIVRLERVCKDYREGDLSRQVLRETSAALPEGEMVAIRGRSGSGKSTLLNLIAGIDTPTSGEVWVAGTRLTGLSPAARTAFRRDHLGFVFQFFNLIPTLTVLENVQLPAELAGRAPHEAARRARALLAEVALAEPRAAFPTGCPAASSSASRSPARSCRTRGCCSPTSRPATSTTRPAAR